MNPAVTVHLILDNYGTHKHPEVKTWFAGHPRYRVHFTPTGFFRACANFEPRQRAQPPNWRQAGTTRARTGAKSTSGAGETIMQVYGSVAGTA